jgi:outer membrane receptor protein involved in Fe transport
MDLAETVRFGSFAGGAIEGYVNINNVLDKDPPGVGEALVAFVTGGDPYDLIGRTYKVGVRFQF